MELHLCLSTKYLLWQTNDNDSPFFFFSEKTFQQSRLINLSINVLQTAYPVNSFYLYFHYRVVKRARRNPSLLSMFMEENKIINEVMFFPKKTETQSELFSPLHTKTYLICNLIIWIWSYILMKWHDCVILFQNNPFWRPKTHYIETKWSVI